MFPTGAIDVDVGVARHLAVTMRSVLPAGVRASLCEGDSWRLRLAEDPTPAWTLETG